jgi:hypothetical protein
MTELYTTSRLRVMRRCPTEHHLRYGLGIRSPDTSDTLFGTAGHFSLEHYYRAWQLVKSADVRLDRAREVRSLGLSPADEVKLDLLVVGYAERWGGEAWEVLDVEREFSYQLGAYRIGGKIDAIIRRLDDGRVFVLEHKFTGSNTAPGSAYWEKLTIDTQVSIYVDGAKVLGHDVAGCIYDVIVRPDHDLLEATPEDKREYTKGKGCKDCGGKVGVAGSGDMWATDENGNELVGGLKFACSSCNGTGWKEPPRLHARQRAERETVEAFRARVGDAIAEDPDRFFKRSTVVRLPDELPRMRLDLQQAIWVHEMSTAAGVLFRNTDACARYGEMCPYFAICSGTGDVNDTNRFPRGPVHAELANP